MDCWNLLGLDMGADARAVKRQYARLLKLTRPDDDPDGFQRLREAYDQALGYIQWRQDVECDEEAVSAVEPATLFGDPEPLATVIEVAPQPPIQLESLDPDSLDAALAQAQGLGVRSQFEQVLLSRCLAEGALALSAVQWALDRLRWFTAWQVVDLEPAALRKLAGQLLDARLDQLRATLAEPDYAHERVALELLKRLLQEPWLQGFDQRAQFHQQWAALLFGIHGWSGEFFDRMCDVVGWDEKRGALPIPVFQYQQLKDRHGVQAMVARIQQDLSVAKPQSATELATWFVLKPLSNGQRRLMADRFDDETWYECDQLETTVLRTSGMLNRLGIDRLPDWRRWRLGSTRADHYLFWWPALFVLITALTREFDSGGLIAAAMASTFLVIIGSSVIKLWNLLVRPLASLDVWLGERLLPARYCRDGTGLLPLRHLMPCVLLGALICHLAWDAFGPNAAGMGVAGTFVLMAYLNYVLSGDTPRLLTRILVFLKAEGVGVFVWLVILGFFIGLGAFIHRNPVTPSGIDPLCLPSAGALQQPELCAKPNPNP